MVERTIAWLTRGNRRVRYRGVAKNDHWLHHRAAALNLRRLITLGLAMTEPPGHWPDTRTNHIAANTIGTDKPIHATRTAIRKRHTHHFGHDMQTRLRRRPETRLFRTLLGRLRGLGPHATEHH